jgi:NADPH-dependent 7-cyano-7-deazaguanine reductase QueF-like protein
MIWLFMGVDLWLSVQLSWREENGFNQWSMLMSEKGKQIMFRT